MQGIPNALIYSAVKEVLPGKSCVSNTDEACQHGWDCMRFVEEFHTVNKKIVRSKYCASRNSIIVWFIVTNQLPQLYSVRANTACRSQNSIVDLYENVYLISSTGRSFTDTKWSEASDPSVIARFRTILSLK